MIGHFIYMFIEINTLKEVGYYNYSKDFENFTDWINIVTFLTYAIIKIKYDHLYAVPFLYYKPPSEYDERNIQKAVHCLVCICVLMMFIKINYFLQIFPKYGLLRALV